MTVYRYRSPYRELPLGYLPEPVRLAWDYDNSTIGMWTPETIYAFTEPIPERYISQWDLVVLPEINKE